MTWMLGRSAPSASAGGAGAAPDSAVAAGRGHRRAGADPARRGTQLETVLALLPILIGLVAAIRTAWVCDDAFISFRYVDNFERGLGLVYNEGERVEGYTHFLWVVLLAAVRRTGIDLVDLGHGLPLVFHVGTLAVLAAWSLRRPRPAGVVLPLAAWGVALHRDMQVWASGGMETAAFTFCMLATVVVVSRPSVRPGAVATCAALATLFRPEGLLLSASVAGLLAWRRTSALARFAGVWLALVVPLFVWRVHYYGDWLPNTYYAKSAGLANWGQGWHYVASYFSVYPVLGVGLFVAMVGGWIRRHERDDALLACAAVAVPMLLYVLRVGGDFMFARFLIPVTPLLYLALEETVRGRRPIVRILAASLVVAPTALAGPARQRSLSSDARAHGIVDEHAMYPPTAIEERREQGSQMRAIFGDLPVRVCILGSQASFAYFARFPYVFEKYGLTDRKVAHESVARRGRPGHERGLSRRDLMQRRVHFIFTGKAEDRTSAIDEAVFGSLLASVVFYDRSLMDALRDRPGVAFVDYPAYLDSIVLQAPAMSFEARRSAWAFARGYYFDHNSDPERYGRAATALSGGTRGEQPGR